MSTYRSEQVELPRERHSVDGSHVERLAQQHAERRDHAIGRAGVLVHELGNRVQRVEEKVRVQLHLEQLEPGFGQPRLELRGAQLPFASRPIVLERVHRRDDGPVDDVVRREVADDESTRSSRRGIPRRRVSVTLSTAMKKPAGACTARLLRIRPRGAESAARARRRAASAPPMEPLRQRHEERQPPLRRLISGDERQRAAHRENTASAVHPQDEHPYDQRRRIAGLVSQRRVHRTGAMPEALTWASIEAGRRAYAMTPSIVMKTISPMPLAPCVICVTTRPP